MNKIKILLTALLLFTLWTNASAQLNFSDSARYSIITCAPGTEVYSMYGHSALRVIDPLSRQDVVFNYGIFSFQTENFLFKFVKGETDYQLGVYPFKNFMQEYILDNRMVWEQRLNLRTGEKQTLKNLILTDYLPENRVYRYSFFYDNCATKIRDRVLKSVHDTIVIAEAGDDRETFRELLEPLIKNFVWVHFGIDLAVAKPADQETTFEEEMFLPDYLMNNFELLMAVNNGDIRPIVTERVVLNNGIEKIKKASLPPSLWFAGLFILTIVMFYFLAESKPQILVLGYIYFAIVGIAGLLLSFLTFFSVHPAMSPNFNLLWAAPTHLLVLVLMIFKPLKKYTDYYWMICIPYYLLVSFALLTTGQYVPPAVYLINGILFVSAIFMTRALHVKRKNITIS